MTYTDRRHLALIVAAAPAVAALSARAGAVFHMSDERISTRLLLRIYFSMDDKFERLPLREGMVLRARELHPAAQPRCAALLVSAIPAASIPRRFCIAGLARCG